MPFEQGAVTCRMLLLPRPLPDDAIEKFAADAAPSLGGSTEAIQGWVTGRHLLDREINEETATYGGHLRLTLLKAERKVPSSLLRAECKMEELVYLAASDVGFLNGKQRAEIKREVEDRLRPSMPPSLTGLPFIHHEPSGILFVGAPSVKQLDLFTAQFIHTFGFAPIPCRPDTLAMEQHSVDIRNWQPSSFAPDLPPDRDELQPGREFLTWLWYWAEARGGMIALEGLGDIALAIDGPLFLIHEGNGAHESVLRKGAPSISAEAKTCLLSGKLLRQATVILSQNEENYTFGFDADEFVIRSLKLPDTDATDPITRFQDRMQQLDTVREILFALFQRFLAERNVKANWSKARLDIAEWIKNKPGRV